MSDAVSEHTIPYEPTLVLVIYEIECVTSPYFLDLLNIFL